MATVITPLHALLAARGMNFRDLSRATTLSYGTIRNIACGNNRTRTGRDKIEAFLGVQLFPAPADSETRAQVTSESRERNSN